MSKHTPGPWDKGSVDFAMNDGAVAVMAGSSDDDRKRICLVDAQVEVKRGQGHKTACAERDANRDLIAAAPDLLSALKQTLIPLMAYRGMGWVDRGDVLPTVQAAIAKAEGQQ